LGKLLDIKFIRENLDIVRDAVANKGEKADIDRILHLDSDRRRILQEVEELRGERNRSSREIGELQKKGKNADDLKVKMKAVSDKIKALEKDLSRTETELNGHLLEVPNIPHESVPIGKSEEDNVEIRKWGDPPAISFEPKPHWEIGEKLGIIDIERGGKITGSGFLHYRGAGALLERALINFMIDLHVRSHGFVEVMVPFMVNRTSMTVTGQIPKLEGDMYALPEDDTFLVPTAEVPVTNIHRGEIISADSLPIYYVAYSPCFRREAGAHGKDTRGLIRVHQFNKVELVKFVRPETSYDELESLVSAAEVVLQQLSLPYRVVVLSTGDLSFAASKCYDLEVWAPGLAKYLEVSSCSNFQDFQARRGEIRYRPGPGKKPQFVHTLNGSGVALPRTVIAILENYQQEDGSVIIPEVLRPYMGGLEKIE
jgi:seryl-tRNA synthetase